MTGDLKHTTTVILPAVAGSIKNINTTVILREVAGPIPPTVILREVAGPIKNIDITVAKIKD